MTDVTYRCAVRLDVSDREESWYVTSTYSGQADFSDCATVKAIARKLTSMAVSLISDPNSPLAQKYILGVDADFGHGYARAEVKYVARCQEQVSSVSLMAIVEDSLPVLEQSEIFPTATRMINGCN